MTQTTKRIALLCLVVTLGAVIFLSSSLSNLQLQDGMPFPGGGNSGDASQPASSVGLGDGYASTLVKGIFDLILLILLISVPLRLISFLNAKKLVRVLLVLAALFLLAILLSRLPGGEPAPLPGESSGSATQPSVEYPVSPLGQPPQGIVWVVIVAAALGAGFLVLTLLRQPRTPAKVEDQLAQEAESALRAIKVGESVRSVVIRCYLQMNRVLQEEQEIERGESMTVREFEDWLERKGFPRAPLQQLSRLFESVRYGRQEISKEDENMAVESLNQIIQFCKSRGTSAP